jgi:hypothetical protein
MEQTDLKAYSDRMAKELMDSMMQGEAPAATAVTPRTGSNGK